MTSAAQARRELSALGQELTAARGDIAQRRGDALRGGRAFARTFDELAAAPQWLRVSRTALVRLGRQVALQASGRALGASIEGKQLGRIAEQCGEEDLDAAIGRAEPTDDLPLPNDPAREGMALLAVTLTPALRGYLTDLPPAEIPAARVEGWIARVLA